MMYNPHKHHRKSIRLKGYDYSQAGLYFITICCQDRAHLFGEIEQGELILNKYGDIAIQEWTKTTQIRTNCQLHEFVIMPNHIHGIIEIIFQKEEEKNEIGAFKSPSQTIGSIIRGFKIATIKKIKDFIQEKDSHTGESQSAPAESNLLNSASTKKIKSLDFKIWQRNYYEHIIRNENDYNRISKYIINNPQKWENDKLK